MKNIFSKSLFFLALVLMLFSCSNNSGVQYTINIEDSLKDISDQKEIEMTWTKELESVRLVRDVSKYPSVAANVKISPEVMAVSISDNPPIFPLLDGFGSLDVTLISSDLYVFLDNFCDKLKEWQFDESLMDESAIPSVLIFKYDIEQLWQTDVRLLNDKIYGEPFFDSDQIMVPVRLSNEKVFIDFNLYIKQDGDFKLNQIELNRFESD